MRIRKLSILVRKVRKTLRPSGASIWRKFGKKTSTPMLLCIPMLDMPNNICQDVFSIRRTLKALRTGGPLTKKRAKMSENAKSRTSEIYATVTAPANIFAAFNSTVGVLQKSPSSLQAYLSHFGHQRASKSSKNEFMPHLTPPSDHISENFKKKSGQPEWP